MNIILSTVSGIPLYEQITEQVQTNILKQVLTAGDSMPSIRNFASDLGVSVITIKRSYDDLENCGYIKSIPAKGYFVCSNNIDNMRDVATAKLEKSLDKIIITAKSLSISKDDFISIIDILFDEL